MKRPVLVLASNSPRRRQLLALAGWEFTVRPAEVDESPQPGEAPQDYVLRLAESKARACAQAGVDGDILLAADTTVSLDGDLLGKPTSPAQAHAMLVRLRGRSHQVFTAIALLQASSGQFHSDLCVTQVPMRDYSLDEIEAYIASGDPLDKAGAYAIQHPDFHPVEALAGCFASVMGLPLCHLQRSLESFGRVPPLDLPSRCQASLDYACPVSRAILAGEDVG